MRCLLGVAALVVVATVSTPMPAGAVRTSSCTPSAGTVVAVDFAHWGGPVVRGCDTSDPDTGAELLTNVGFRMTGTQHDGPAFICRIGNAAYRGGRQYPTAADDACVLTPPATAYWSYWLAAPGADRWTYSSWGAYAPQSRPEPGGVELWIFGGTRTKGSRATPVDGFPVCSPDSLRAGGSAERCTPRTKPARHTKKRRHERFAAPTASTASTASTRAPASGSAMPTTPTSATASRRPSTSSSSTRTPTVPIPSNSAQNSTRAAVVEARPASTRTPPSGSPMPLLVGVGLAVVLFGAGTVAVRRRHGQQ